MDQLSSYILDAIRKVGPYTVDNLDREVRTLQDTGAIEFEGLIGRSAVIETLKALALAGSVRERLGEWEAVYEEAAVKREAVTQKGLFGDD